MSRKYKRILSLVLALVMICSAMSVMAFAAETALESFCFECKEDRVFIPKRKESFNRIIQCPKELHDEHDAEEWYITTWFQCEICGNRVLEATTIEYVCLR